MSGTPSDQEARDAVVLATGFLPSLSLSPDEYRVILVENILSGERASPVRWRVGFKRRALFPAQPDGLIGKGGEVFVEVDTSTRQSVRAKGGD